MPYALAVALWLLAAASVWTVGQRIVAGVPQRRRPPPGRRPVSGGIAGRWPPTPGTPRAGAPCVPLPRAAGAGGVPGRRRPRRPPRRAGVAPAAREPGPGASRTRGPGRARRAGARRRCAATPGTGARRSGCPRWTWPRSTARWTPHVRGAEPAFDGRRRRAAGWSSRCRTAATGTSPGCGSSRRCARLGPRAGVHHGGRSGCAPSRCTAGSSPTGSRSGFEVVAADDGPAAYRALTRRLRAGGVVCLLADRDLHRRPASRSSFFGEPARLPAGPARLAGDDRRRCCSRRSRGSPPTAGRCRSAAPGPGAGPRRRCRRPPRRSPTRSTALIAQAPADWHMLQPIWTADRAPTALRPVAR